MAIGLFNPGLMMAGQVAPKMMPQTFGQRMGGLFNRGVQAAGNVDPSTWFSLAGALLTPPEQRGQAFQSLASQLVSNQRYAQGMQQRREERKAASQERSEERAEDRERFDILRGERSEERALDNQRWEREQQLREQGLSAEEARWQAEQEYRVALAGLEQGRWAADYDLRRRVTDAQLGAGGAGGGLAQMRDYVASLLPEDDPRRPLVASMDMNRLDELATEVRDADVVEQQAEDNLRSAALSEAQASDARMRALNNAIGTVEQGRGLMPTGVGFGSQILAWIGGNPASDVRAYMNTVSGAEAFQTLTALREAATARGERGSGLGQVTQREIELLQSIRTSLDQNMSPGAFKREARELMRQLIELRAERERVMQSDFPDIYYEIFAGRDRASAAAADAAGSDYGPNAFGGAGAPPPEIGDRATSPGLPDMVYTANGWEVDRGR